MDFLQQLIAVRMNELQESPLHQGSGEAKEDAAAAASSNHKDKRSAA